MISVGAMSPPAVRNRTGKHLQRICTVVYDVQIAIQGERNALSDGLSFVASPLISPSSSPVKKKSLLEKFAKAAKILMLLSPASVT